MFADARGIVQHVVSDSSGMCENWRSFPVGAVRRVFVEDLDRDGRSEIIVYTEDARIYVWDTVKYELIWESTKESFETIQAMAMADVDTDDALERTSTPRLSSSSGPTRGLGTRSPCSTSMTMELQRSSESTVALSGSGISRSAASSGGPCKGVSPSFVLRISGRWPGVRRA